MPINAIGNRVKVRTATTGTGTLTLGAAYSSAFFTFAEGGIGDGEVVSYTIEEAGNVEIGIGTYTTAGTTLSRDTVIASKIAGVAGTTKITLATGNATVFLSIVSDAAGSAVILPDIQFADGAGVYDDSGNEQLIFRKTASAVNYFEINNNETGESPSLVATGSDADVGVTIFAKGIGGFACITPGDATDDDNVGGLNVIVRTTGVAQSGFGSECLNVRLSNDAGDDIRALRILSSWSNPTAAAESARARFFVMDAGTETVRIDLSDTGVGFNTSVAAPAGGSTAARLTFGTTALGIYFGSGAPTVSAPQGSLYLRTDGGATTRAYINTDGGTTWTALVSVA